MFVMKYSIGYVTSCSGTAAILIVFVMRQYQKNLAAVITTEFEEYFKAMVIIDVIIEILSQFLIELQGFLTLNCVIIIAMAMAAEQGYSWIININIKKNFIDIAKLKISLIASS